MHEQRYPQPQGHRRLLSNDRLGVAIRKETDMPKQADARVQRLVVLQVLKRECGVAARTEIGEALCDIEPAVIDETLQALEKEDIILVEGERITATSSTLHLDRLGLISL